MQNINKAKLLREQFDSFKSRFTSETFNVTDSQYVNLKITFGE